MGTEQPKKVPEADAASIIDADGVQYTLEQTEAFLQWFRERERVGRPDPEKKEDSTSAPGNKKADAEAAPESAYPDWMEEWHALHAKNTAEQHAKETGNNEPALPIGKYVYDGVYIGQYVLRDFTGDSLGKVFNVFAAPVDLDRKPKTYDKTLKAVSKLRNWYSFNGGAYETAKALFDALKNGSYKGEWVIPPAELLDGKDLKGNLIQPDNLTKHLNAGALNGSLRTGPNWPDWYWSCTEVRSQGSSLMYAVRFRPDKRAHSNSNINKVGCRLIRFVPVKTQRAAHG